MPRTPRGHTPHKSGRRARRLLIILAAILLLVAGVIILGVILILVTGALASRPAGTPEAVELADADLSDNMTSATVLAVGEATHGTREFRTAWQTVAQKVADKGFTTIALEENAGPVTLVDAYVQGGPGTAEEAAQRFGFRLNKTREMADFLKWAREYNEGRAEDQRIRFYGLDMQRPTGDRDVALTWLRDVNAEAAASLTKRLESITSSTANDKDAGTSLLPVAQDLKSAVDTAASGRNDDATLRAQLSATALVQGMKRASVGVSTYDRDAALHDNLAWLVQQRETAGGHHTLLLAHNGHVDRAGQASTAPGSKLGVLAAQHWGDKYRVIGTDARIVKLTNDGQVFSFTVNSPIRGIFAGTKVGYLEVATSSPTNREVLNRAMPMASAGNLFASWYAWIPFFHEIRVTPAQDWDALIYIDESSPTTPLVK